MTSETNLFYEEELASQKGVVRALQRAELEKLLAKAKEIWENMTPSERQETLRKQAEGWARSEIQWAKDFAEGKCERD